MFQSRAGDDADGLLIRRHLADGFALGQGDQRVAVGQTDMATGPRHLLVGRSVARWLEAGGCVVRLVSMTDGRSGHQDRYGPALVERRRAEARAAGALIGVDYDVLDHPDGALLPTLEARLALIRLIRTFAPDLILTHRPGDYHPDHRYTATLVQDAAYMVTVPAVCPDVPHLSRNPVIATFSDDFKRPVPFSPDILVDIGSVMDEVVGMLHCHASQFYEWLPFNGVLPATVPLEDEARRAWLADWFRRRLAPLADRYRARLLEDYGEAGRKVEFVEAFEVSEYGAPLAEDLAEEWEDVRRDE
jgi:N-acetylglucosamine malate deacetylase 1